MGLSQKQFETLMKPLNATRVAKRSQGGKQLSYLESWDVRAHLIRVFGFGNFDIETLEYREVGTREYQSKDGKDMVEVIYSARVRLSVRTLERMDPDYATPLCTYVECAVGSASGPANMLGEHHDNALKTAVSDATKRCAINLGTQFGLSLYDSGSTREVVKGTLVQPGGEVEPAENDGLTEEQMQALQNSLGATVIENKEEGATNGDDGGAGADHSRADGE